jgi:hypothetical protein
MKVDESLRIRIFLLADGRITCEKEKNGKVSKDAGKSGMNFRKIQED